MQLSTEITEETYMACNGRYICCLCEYSKERLIIPVTLCVLCGLYLCFLDLIFSSQLPTAGNLKYSLQA